MNRPQIVTAPPQGISAAVLAVIDDLQRQLRNPEEKRAVHRIRMDSKRLRAWLQLVRHNADDFDWRSRDRTIRDIARQLSAKRDAQVVLDTLLWLEKKVPEQSQRCSIEQVRLHIRFDLGRHDIDWASLSEPLDNEWMLLREQAVLLGGTAVAREGLKRTYKRARKRGNSAFARQGTIEDLHKLRKWVKYLCYQVAFLREVYPDMYGKVYKRLDELGDKLGRIHDLDIVQHKIDQIADMEGCREATRDVNRCIEARVNKLLKRCDRLYKKIFNPSQAKFIRCLT